MEVSLTFYPSWPQIVILPISTSRVPGIIDMYHHSWQNIVLMKIKLWDKGRAWWYTPVILVTGEVAIGGAF
jgi:hypothetical protein